MTECTFCRCDVAAHDPVYVSDDVGASTADAYCNYACLAAHIEEAGLTTGATCRVDL